MSKPNLATRFSNRIRFSEYGIIEKRSYSENMALTIRAEIARGARLKPSLCRRIKRLMILYKMATGSLFNQRET
jgi:hypothetical protein